MTAQDRQALYTQLQTLMTTYSLSSAEIAAAASAAKQAQLLGAATAKLSVSFTLLGAGDWQTLKTFLVDGGGGDDYPSYLTNAKAAIGADNQASFWLNLLMSYKAARNRMPQLGL
jgi:hypothetical protein